MHVCITLRFAGTRYHGFQVQKNALSVCEVLQNALESLYGVRPPVKGCSRTDSGVQRAWVLCQLHAAPSRFRRASFRLPSTAFCRTMYE